MGVDDDQENKADLIENISVKSEDQDDCQDADIAQINKEINEDK